MKALSIRQPWAWLIVNGWKNVENREWSTNVRGTILIHASATMTRADHEACKIFVGGIHPDVPIPAFGNCSLLRGGIVGAATLLDCCTHHSSEWFTGPFGFILADATPFPFVPMKGRLGFFEVDL